MKKGLLLIQLGTPQDPTPEKVEVYLKQFLMDKFVIDIPWVLRWPLVNLIIAPKRSFASAEAYEQIWTERGSPLRFHTEDLSRSVDSLLSDVKVKYAMRYGSPSIKESLDSLKDCDEIYVIPLYPQYALSSTETALEEVNVWQDQGQYEGHIRYMKDFFAEPEFIQAQAKNIREGIEAHKPDHILMSFHGLPVRHVKKTASICFKTNHCCDEITKKNRFCYRAQSFATARALAKELQWPKEKYTVSFQSRLGRSEWIPPYTDHLLDQLPAQGVKRLLVTCPSFTTDCLETLEEIGLRAKQQFIDAGGEDLFLVPSLNSDSHWAPAFGAFMKNVNHWTARVVKK